MGKNPSHRVSRNRPMDGGIITPTTYMGQPPIYPSDDSGYEDTKSVFLTFSSSSSLLLACERAVQVETIHHIRTRWLNCGRTLGLVDGRHSNPSTY